MREMEFIEYICSSLTAVSFEKNCHYACNYDTSISCIWCITGFLVIIDYYCFNVKCRFWICCLLQLVLRTLCLTWSALCQTSLHRSAMQPFCAVCSIQRGCRWPNNRFSISTKSVSWTMKRRVKCAKRRSETGFLKLIISCLAFNSAIAST